MKPQFKIYIDGSLVNWDVSSISITDKSGYKSDTLVVNIATNQFDAPLSKKELEVHMGFGDNLAKMGKFMVNKIVEKSPPKIITLYANGADLSSKLKEQKSNTFHNITLGSLVEKIASQSGLEHFIHSTLANIELGTLIQNDESDINLLTRLAGANNAFFSVKNNKLMMIDKDNHSNSQNDNLPIFKIERCIDYTIDHNLVEYYSGVKVRYHLKDEAETKTILVGKNSRVKTIHKVFNNESEARKVGESALKELQSAGKTLDLKIVGNENLIASGIVIFKNQNWKIEQIIHSIDVNFTSQISAKIQPQSA